MALQKLRFLSFNNYYNRKVKPRGSYIQDYADALIPRYDFAPSVSFNPGNWVDTYGIEAIDWPESLSWRPDYLLVYHHNDTTNKDVIDSRWFITAWDRTKIGQYKMRLHRDVMVDHLDAIMDTPVYLERGILNDNDPYIFNDEGIAVNQIKTSETLLKDESKIAWIVGYVARDYAGGNIQGGATAIADIFTPRLQDWAYYNQYQGTPTYGFPEDIRITIKEPIGGVQYNATFDYYTGQWTGSNQARLNAETNVDSLKTLIRNAINSNSKYKSNISTIFSYTDYVINSVQPDAQGNTFFKLYSHPTDGSTTTAVTQELINAITTIVDAAWSDVDNLIIQPIATRSAEAYTGTIAPLASGIYHTTIENSATRFHLKDAPYDMFCIPYGNVTIENSDVSPWSTFTMNKEEALTVAQTIATNLGTNLYDLQILPFCPMTGFDYSGTTIDINADNDGRYNLVKKSVGGVDVPCAIMLWSTASSGHKIINLNISVDNNKMSSLTDFYRLISPNRSGVFEFNAAKNGGIRGFDLYYTYLPYSPFIQLNPLYSGLYGQSFADARGLTIQGDFSISYTSDPWIDYQVQNKNYSQIFQRELTNMDVQHKYNMIEGGASTIAGAGQAAASGAVIGTMIAPGVGTALGAGLGAAASLGIGAADQVINQKRYEEDRSFAVDNFAMQCDNIKALPQSLNKTTAYNGINTLFPVLEYYTCTNEEKLALARKIKYNGMTIGRIGTIAELRENDFTYSIDNQEVRDEGFVRGKMIRLANRVDGELPAIAENYEVLIAIANELEKGVYFK